ncbi:hypothetical protein UFOVP238_38 [uncultured Caudovirales phage]|uniref:Uncharacterized protein n=1 Tax=uncultured Caudovirales phage TaxID=2100421 RepID=A0A6J7WU68_9CAUD|nr:hypothetical protein UFOVP238_38 [uncultured Caudovirales phage]
MLSQVSSSTQIIDSAGWGLAEWIAVITLACLVIGTVVGAIVQLVRLRKENTDQHAESRAIVTDVRDRLLDIHTSVSRVDSKVDRIDRRLESHLDWHDNSDNESGTAHKEGL